MKSYNVCIAGLGNVGSYVIQSILNNNKISKKKSLIKFNIIGISAKNKNKKRIFDVKSFKWFNNSLDLINNSDPDILIELIGEEKGISYKLIKLALKNNIHVITANKALLAKHGNELFKIAEENNVLLLFEASVAGGIPIIKVLKESLFSNNIKKISGILNGTTNYILTEMEKNNQNFTEVLKKAKINGFAEANSKNDIEGIDAAHKLTILGVICFGINFNFENIKYNGIANINIEDLKNARKLGYKIKLIGSIEIKNKKIVSIVEPMLINIKSQLANVDGVLNGIKIETDNLDSLFLEGEGAGGKATSSSIISDLFEISKANNFNSLGYKIKQLKNIKAINYSDRVGFYYLRITVKDIPGVLAKITSNLNNENISIETILQIPENSVRNLNGEVPIIITTHKTSSKMINIAIKKIERLDFVTNEIVIISINKE